MSGRFDKALRERLRGDLLEEESLSGHTSLKVGGVAQYFAMPADLPDLQELLKLCADWQVPWVVIGGGYNLLVRDGGFRGVAISLKNLDACVINGENSVRVMAGVNNLRLLRFLQDEGLSGLEFLAGIPGTVGGAVVMNAGCHGHEIMEAVESLELVDQNGCREILTEELVFGYRFMRLEAGKVVAAATFRLQPEQPATVADRVAHYLDKRRVSQQVGYPSAGSFFKNPQGVEAWKLIDAAGMRGARVGNAQVSEVHANFLVNRGGATASDFLELSELVRKAVKTSSGIELEAEVRIIGEDRIRQ